MRVIRKVIILVFLLSFQYTFSQEILKIVNHYVLVNLDESSGVRAGDELAIYRSSSSGQIIWIGKVVIVRFGNGKCAGKILNEVRGNHVQVGDFVRLPSEVSEVQTPMKTHTPSDEMGSPGIEKGDVELGFMGLYTTMVGTDISMETGFIRINAGYQLTDQLQVGVAPQWLIYPGGTGTYYLFSFSFFVSYSFMTTSRWIPYITGEWYQDNFYFGQSDFLEEAYLTIGGGVRNFFTEYAALNTAITYGFSLGGEEYGTVFTITSGISILF